MIIWKDIDCSSFNFTPIGTQDQPFGGTLEGSFNSIFNLKIISKSNFTGLFAFTQRATIRNLYLINVNIQANDDADSTGSLIAYSNNSMILNCVLNTTINEENIIKGGHIVGGLVGNSFESLVEGCCNFFVFLIFNFSLLNIFI